MYQTIKFTIVVCSKVIFFDFLSKKDIFFFAEFKRMMFHNNIVKSSENLNKRNMEEPRVEVVTLNSNFCTFGNNIHM